MPFLCVWTCNIEFEPKDINKSFSSKIHEFPSKVINDSFTWRNDHYPLAKHQYVGSVLIERKISYEGGHNIRLAAGNVRSRGRIFQLLHVQY